MADPYDFEIAIPAGGKAKAFVPSASDDGSPSDAGSASSDISLSESEDDSPVKRKTYAQPVANTKSSVTERRVSGTTTGGGSSALDKAKSFLSKYSSKSIPTSTKSADSSRAKARRVELSSDEEDLSLLELSDDDKRRASNKRAAASRTTRATALSDDEDDEDAKPLGRAITKPNINERQDAVSSDDEADHRRPSSAAKAASMSESEDNHYSDEESEDVSEPAPAYTPRAEVVIPAPTSTWASRNVVKDESEDEVESVASQSNLYESVDEAPMPSKSAVVSKPTVTVNQSLASESGVYEEEDFEDESQSAVAVVPSRVSIVQPGVPVPPAKFEPEPVTRGREDSNFDYSMDFAEGEEVVTPPPVSSVLVEEQPFASRSASLKEDEGEDEQSAFLGSDDDDAGPCPDNTIVVDQNPKTDQSASFASNYQDEDKTPEQSYASLTSTEPARQSPAEPVTRNQAISETVTTSDQATKDLAPKKLEFKSSSTPIISMPQSAASITSTTNSQPQLRQQEASARRSRVLIVREYEQSRENVEKRDASTQCTGNHAGIQADLVPNGMHSLTERQFPPTMDSTTARTEGATTATPPQSQPVDRNRFPGPSPQASDLAPELPPPPSGLPPSFGLYDPLQLPTATSMSIYKQQLLALQQQIQRKKLESETFFRDRLSFRYSSLRSTDEYLAVNRPLRLPLWEALIRVDPTMDEAKAREIARLASDGAA